jgi:glycosyltransferase involved in cell wall biosynthesis
MRIVIDLQSAQAINKNRGIGRYSVALARAMIRHKGDHEIIIALSGLFPETILPIRQAFADLLPSENICVWNGLEGVSYLSSQHNWRRKASSLTREAFLASLKPDVIHVTSLFEGYADDALTCIDSLSTMTPIVVTLYDLIPYLHPELYLTCSELKNWYEDKIVQLQKAHLWLAISDYTKNEGIENLKLPIERVVNISTDVDEHFQEYEVVCSDRNAVLSRAKLTRPFVMYTGGADHRKNIDGLIRAYAKLSIDLRNHYQLAIVCSMNDSLKTELLCLIDELGLTQNDVILTGFVSESDLIALYNICDLFVFPSWHEGFGMPVLEAMRCGAPVIGANTTSLPEVIGWKEALFDPYNTSEMATLIEKGLVNALFRQQLLENGQRQSAKFSWDNSARVAISAIEKLLDEQKKDNTIKLLTKNALLKLAYLSPMPPARSGIADYSEILLPALSQFYDIEVIVNQEDALHMQTLLHIPVRTVEWFLEHSNQYERVIYHIGNSSYHQYMFSLLKSIPGVIVLHDFFLSNLYEYIEQQRIAYTWSDALYVSHGYKGLVERFTGETQSQAVWSYPASLGVIQDSEGVIVHSQYAVDLANFWYADTGDDWRVIPLVRNKIIASNAETVRARLGFSSTDTIVCAFGLLGPTKLNHQLIDAWFASSLGKSSDSYLIFVGENSNSDYGKQTLLKLSEYANQDHVRITGWVDAEIYKDYLSIADIGVQLRTLSRGESSASVLDCMGMGVATIVNANGSMKDLDDQAVYKLQEDFAIEGLVTALESLAYDKALRDKLGKHAKQIVENAHSPAVCAEQYYDAIESFYRARSGSLFGLADQIASIESAFHPKELQSLAAALASSFPPRCRQRQILVDISELVQRDSKTGIQRVVRSILSEWLHHPPADYRIEPVFATADQTGYFYARHFTLGFLNLTTQLLDDEAVDYFEGDIFLGLDLQPNVVPAQEAAYQAMRACGVRVLFVVYDLLPVLFPHHFPAGADVAHEKWLSVVANADGAVCISKAVADNLLNWLSIHKEVSKSSRFSVDWFHLGADVQASKPSKGMPVKAEALLSSMRKHLSFLMVGTLEPRKGHLQTLQAFNQLWQEGQDINLVIVGKQGWLVETLVTSIRQHPHLNRRLFWLTDVSDELLELLYRDCDCLIAASEGEGFGLPLIEAARYKKPILARDVPVFREVAGENAYYFSNTTNSVELADDIKKWLLLYQKDEHPKSNHMTSLTWKESAKALLSAITLIK